MVFKFLKNKQFENFVFLSLFQSINFVSLVVFIPYLTQKVGIEKYGLITVLYAICSFFFVLIDFGFSITSVRKISLNSNNIDLIHIINTTIGAKMLLLLFSLPFFFLACFFFLKSNFTFSTVLLSYFALVGQAFFPIWLTQGLEANKMAFFANLINKLLFGVLVFLFIKFDFQFNFYLFFMGLSNILTGISLLYIVVNYKLKFKMKFRFNFKDVVQELNEGKEVFLSNLSISFYLNIVTLILSLNVSPFLMGLYGIIERIMVLFRTLLGVYVQALYPMVCKLVYQLTLSNLISKLVKYTVPFVIVLLLLNLGLYFFSTNVSNVFADTEIPLLANYIEKISFLPLFVALNIIPNLVILAYKKEKYKSYILVISTLVCFLLTFWIVPIFKINGVVFLLHLYEIIVATCSVLYLNYLVKSQRGF